jgi:chromosome partitioning protein
LKRIAIINQKGGVGKTTTAANLGAALGRLGKRVLLIDLDAQANLTLHLSEDEGVEKSAFDLLVEGDPITEIMRPTSEKGVSLVPASEEMAGIEQALSQTIGRELLLRDALAALETASVLGFDLVLIDCPPSLGVLSLNALAASDGLLIPLQTEFFALQGMTQLLEVVDLVQSRLNPKLKVLGIVPCMVDQRTNLSAEVLSEIERHFGKLLFQTRIRKNVKLAEAPSFGKSIFAYAPDSNGALDYARLAHELLQGSEAPSQTPARNPAQAPTQAPSQAEPNPPLSSSHPSETQPGEGQAEA